MQSDIVSIEDNHSADQPRVDGLGERLDGVIGEASSGMGALLSELLRRSLKAGVSDIGSSLGEYAEEKVEEAVERQMPAISEAADAVALSTSRRIATEAAEAWERKSAEQKQELEAKIQAAESTTLDKSRHQAETIVEPVRAAIETAKVEASEHLASAEEKLNDLRLKGKETWKKLKHELTSLTTTQQSLQQHNEQLTQTVSELRLELQQQRQLFSELSERYQTVVTDQQSLRSDQQTLVAEQRSFAERVAKLEQPRGIRALFAKVSGGGQKKKEPKISDTEGPQSDAGSQVDD